MADVTSEILAELTLYGRRARTLVERQHPDLTFVAYAILGHVYDERGCRAVDLARAHELDKSTVSRQVGDLIRRGLVQRADDGLITVTPEGRARLEGARDQQIELLTRRLETWTTEERATFARLLHRYNAG